MRLQVRVGVVNNNKPAVLTKILSIFGDHNLNIQQQVNKSRGDVAYNVIDVEIQEGTQWKAIQKDITMIDEVISSRFIWGKSPVGGYGYAKNMDGKYWA